MSDPLAREIVACRGCDLLLHLPQLRTGDKARCPRCGEVLASAPFESLEQALALTIATIVAFAVAQAFPLLEVSVAGRTASTTILGAAQRMWIEGDRYSAVLVGFCSTVAPGAFIGSMLAILLAMRRQPTPRWVGWLLRWATHVQPWSMSEVMMLGILVTLIKIAQLTTVKPGIGLYAVAVLMLLLAVIASAFDARHVWARIEWAELQPASHSDDAPPTKGVRT